MDPRSGVVLLLGAPGVGKSTLGKLLQGTHSCTVQAFVNVGEQLRATGKVEQHLRHPTSTSKQDLARLAHSILEKACRSFKEQENRSSVPQVLLLECVKELNDAYDLMQLLDLHGLKLQQVLYIPQQAEGGSACTTGVLRQCLTNLQDSSISTCSVYDKYGNGTAMTEQRQAKWQHNMSALLEFFSSLGVLSEIAAWQVPVAEAAAAANSAESLSLMAPAGPASVPTQRTRTLGVTSADSSTGAGLGSLSLPVPSTVAPASISNSSSSESSPGMTSPPDTPQPAIAPVQPPAGTLASLGYAAVINAQSSWLHRVGWCSGSTGNLRALNALLPQRQVPLALAGLSSSRDIKQTLLRATPIEPVVSPRLVTSLSERQRVLRFVSESTGLFTAGNSSSTSSSGGAGGVNSNSSSSTGGGPDKLHHVVKAIPVPTQSVSTTADARWVAVPGRYMVAHKGDGTRHLLILPHDDPSHCYLLNRAGMLYKYPYSLLLRPDGPASSSAGQKTQQHCDSQSNNSAEDTTTAAEDTTTTASSVSSSRTSSDSRNATAALLPTVNSLPAGTVLDGELVWLPDPGMHSSSASRGYFAVFDVLSVGRRQVWQLPLQDRLSELQGKLHLASTDELEAAEGALGVDSTTVAAAPCAAKTSSSSSSSSSIDDGRSSSGGSKLSQPPSFTIHVSEQSGGAAASIYSRDTAKVQVSFTAHKKQQAPLNSDDSIRLVLKPHYDVSAAVLEQLQADVDSGKFPFPTDGLVFTPKAMPYVLGLQPLLIKWQPLQQTAVDLTDKHLQEGYSTNYRFEEIFEITARLGYAAARQASEGTRKCLQQLPRGLVYECVALTAAHVSREGGTQAAPSPQQQRRLQELKKRKEQVKPVWVPQSVRWDKATGNDASVLKSLQRRLQRPALASISRCQLVQAVRQVQELVLASSYTNDPAAVHSAPKPSAATPLAAASSGDGPVPASSSSSRGTQHLAKAMPFKQLYAALSDEAAAGTVERTVDKTSGLEVFCYNMSEPPCSAVAAMCRGLVLHPESEAVVATPFVRFDDLRRDQVGLKKQDTAAASGSTSAGSAAAGTSSSTTINVNDRGCMGRGRGKGKGRGQAGSRGAGSNSNTSAPQRLTAAERAELELTKQVSAEDDANLQLYRSWHSQAPASASFKLDGSLIIAFVWQGQLYTCTRRRMDSEQAVWACTWLQQNIPAGALQPGWTYMFEALYYDNTHVIQYPFEALVLLAAVDASGHQLPSPAALQQLARQLGLLAAPSLEGTVPELTARLSQGCKLAHSSSSSTSSSTSGKAATAAKGRPSNRDAYMQMLLDGQNSNHHNSSSSRQQPANFEGFVLQDPKSGQRYKLVHEAFHRTGHAASKLLHPLAVWDAVYCGQSRAELAQGLPAHYLAELDAMLTALEQPFWTVQQQLQNDLQLSWLPGSEPAQATAPLAVDVSATGGLSTAASGSSGSSAAANAAAPPAGSLEDDDTAGGVFSPASMPASGAHSSSSSASSISISESMPAGVSISGSSLVSDAVLPQIRQAYAEALQYAQHKNSTCVYSMFLQANSDSGLGRYGRSTAKHGPAPALRGLLLSCIRPSTDGHMQGYTPSAAFAQTYCKGWAQGPKQGRVSVLDPEPLISQVLTDQALMAVLGRLEGRDVGRVLLVCRAWSKLLLGDAGFMARAQQQCRDAGAGRSHVYKNVSDSDYDEYDYVYARYSGYDSDRSYGSF